MQHRPAGFILGQGGAPFAGQGQRLHELPVGFFAPGFPGQLLASQALGLGIVSPGQAVVGQFEQGAQRQPMQPLPLLLQPLVEWQAVASKTGQELTPVPGDRWLQLRAVQSGQEGRNIQGMIAGGVELNR